MRIGFSSMALMREYIVAGRTPRTASELDEKMFAWVEASLVFGEEHGFEFVEIIIESPLMDGEANARRLDEMLSSFSIPVSFHAPFVSNNIVDLDTCIRESSVSEYEHVLRFASGSKTRVKNVTVHPGKINPFLLALFSGVSPAWLVAAAGRLATTRWPSTTNVCFENMPSSTNIFTGIDEIATYYQDPAFHRYKITLDTSHLWICHGMDGFEPFFEKLGEKVVNMHLVDNVSRDNDPHVAIGKGKINFKAILNVAKDHSYEGDLTIEHGDGNDVLHSRDIIQSLL